MYFSIIQVLQGVYAGWKAIKDKKQDLGNVKVETEIDVITYNEILIFSVSWEVFGEFL